jgi:MFS family permease
VTTDAGSLANPSAQPADLQFQRRAWIMVAAAMIGTMCCSTSVVLVNVGVFIRPMAETFGWSRGAIVLSLSIAAISMAVVNPLVGRLIDRYGVRPVLILSLIGYGLATAAVPMLIGVMDLWGLYIGYAVIAGVGAGSNVIAYVRLLSGWFSGPMNHSRGLALGISSAGVPLGHTISGPLAVLLIDAFGWQSGYWGLALMPLAIGLPLAVLVVRPAPSETAGNAKSAKERAALLPGVTIGEAARMRTFWLMLLIAFLMSSCLQGITIHIAPLLSDVGLSAQGLAMMLAIQGALAIIARVGAGYLFDRFFAPYVSIVIFAVAAASAFALAGFPGLILAIIATILIVIGTGAESDLIGYLVGRYFGLKNYGQIFGGIYATFMLGIALGPFLFGVAFDVWGNYNVPFLFAGVGLTAICALLLLLPRFKDEPAPTG